MIKNYIKITEQECNENMQATSEVREITVVKLIAEKGKRIREKSSGVTGSSVECPAENENDYEEIDDPKYAEAVNSI